LIEKPPGISPGGFFYVGFLYNREILSNYF
jgi:hypothetical protein